MGRGHQLLIFALTWVMFCGIATDANSNDDAGAGQLRIKHVKQVGTHHYISWRKVPKRKDLDGIKCPVRSERPELGLAWYGMDDVQTKFAHFESCSDLAQNDTGNWQDYTDRIR